MLSSKWNMLLLDHPAGAAHPLTTGCIRQLELNIVDGNGSPLPASPYNLLSPGRHIDKQATISTRN